MGNDPFEWDCQSLISLKKSKPAKVKKQAPFPTREEVERFIKESTTPVSKRAIARAFGIHDEQRIALKKLLRELKDEGVVEKDHGRKLKRPDGLPATAVVEITSVEDRGRYLCKMPDAAAVSILLRVSDHQAKILRLEGLGKSDRVLVHLDMMDDGHATARPIKRIPRGGATKLVGVVEKAGASFTLRPTDRKNKDEYDIDNKGNIAFAKGDVVVADIIPSRPMGRKTVRVLDNLGPLDHPRVVSLIAIAQHSIPFSFPEEVEKTANALQPAALDGREDLRTRPLVTIDGADARDFDDAVYAASDGTGGWHITVAIADVAHYVKAGSAIDREAVRRGNSVYFPDRVVPMLPEALSNELCSLKPKVDRACLAAHMHVDCKGQLQKFRFTRALMKSAARLTYEQVQKAADGMPDAVTKPLMADVITPLYEAYKTLLAARLERGTLELDIPERQIKIDGSTGAVAHIGSRARLDSHRLIEEFMVLANVAAATALQDGNMPALYRVHDRPSAEKLDGLRGFLKGFGIKLTHGKNIRPQDLAHILEKFVGTEHAPVINEVMLRSQAQAVYSPDNIGHFGLALARYAHFTSPIRRYADLIVHRALIKLFRLGDDGLSDVAIAGLDDLGEQLSQTERRAIDAERSASDRYTALYLAARVGEDYEGRISGVTRAGLFVRLLETGADGFVPMQSLPHDYYAHEEDAQRLRGTRHGLTFQLADRVTVKIVEADNVIGGLRFAITASEGKPRTPRAPDDAPARQHHRSFRRRERRR